MEAIKFDIPKGYEFAGVDDDKQQVVFTKIQPQYPKTYEECCRVLGKTNSFCFEGVSLDEVERIKPFIKLLRCRDAYWGIADWKFNYDDSCYCLCTERDEIQECEGVCGFNAVLAFPTEEMRNVFYENFKELIESCKEFL